MCRHKNSYLFYLTLVLLMTSQCITAESDVEAESDGHRSTMMLLPVNRDTNPDGHVMPVVIPDPLAHVYPTFLTGTVSSQCTCECCGVGADPDEVSSPAYTNDILIAFDSSACFRDH